MSSLNALPSSRASNIKKISESDLMSVEGQSHSQAGVLNHYNGFMHILFRIRETSTRYLQVAKDSSEIVAESGIGAKVGECLGAISSLKDFSY